jgi:hypothetical protein
MTSSYHDQLHEAAMTKRQWREYSGPEANAILASARRTLTEARLRDLAGRLARLENPAVPDPAPATEHPPISQAEHQQRPDRPADTAWLIDQWRDSGWSG